MTDQEIVQALRYCSDPDFKDCSGCKCFRYEDCRERLEADAADLIERLTAENAAMREKMPQWISVEDRLPIDRTKNYLVTFRDTVGPNVDMASYFPSDGWTCDNWIVPQKLITHWMPLPEAPEGDAK